MSVDELSLVIVVDDGDDDPEELREGSPTLEPPDPPLALYAPKRRLLRAWGAVFVGLVVISASGWWVTNSALFDLRTVNVSGNSHTTPADVARLGGLDQRTNVIWFSPKRVERALEQDPWIKEARVSRTLPSVVSVVVVERVPIAVVIPGGWLVSADAVILGPAGADVHLPQISVPTENLIPGSKLTSDVPELDVLSSLPQNVLRLVATVSSETGPIVLTLRNGISVYFGDSSSAAQKALALQAVLTWAARNGIRPLSVDVRAPGSPALVPGPSQGG